MLDTFNSAIDQGVRDSGWSLADNWFQLLKGSFLIFNEFIDLQCCKSPRSGGYLDSTNNSWDCCLQYLD